MSAVPELPEDDPQSVLRLYARDDSGPDGPEDPDPTAKLEDEAEARKRGANAEAFWAGRNRAHRRSAKVAA